MDNKNISQDKTTFIAPDFEELKMILEEPFRRLRVSNGGKGTWFEDGFGDNQTSGTEGINAVILFSHPVNVYFKDSYTTGGNPPVCSSNDGINGRGAPGGRCKACPLGQFDQEKKTRACKSKRRLFLLQDTELSPAEFTVPTTSLSNLKRYEKELSAVGLKPENVVTRISLEKAETKNGFTYTKVNFAFLRMLTEDENTALHLLVTETKIKAARMAGLDLAALGLIHFDPDQQQLPF